MSGKTSFPLSIKMRPWLWESHSQAKACCWRRRTFFCTKHVRFVKNPLLVGRKSVTHFFDKLPKCVGINLLCFWLCHKRWHNRKQKTYFFFIKNKFLTFSTCYHSIYHQAYHLHNLIDMGQNLSKSIVPPPLLLQHCLVGGKLYIACYIYYSCKRHEKQIKFENTLKFFLSRKRKFNYV